VGRLGRGRLKDAAVPPISLWMSRFARFRARLRILARSESGMALPVALFATVSSMALAGAAVVASVDVQQGAKRDSGSKSAIAAADAGVNIATMRLSRYASSLSSSTPCLTESGGTLVTGEAEANGWCPPISGVVGNATYSYRVSRMDVDCGAYDLCIVATGAVGGVSRRIEMTFNESTLGGSGGDDEGEDEEGTTTGGDFEGLVGRDKVTLSGNAVIHVGVGTNGYAEGSGSHIVCGDVRVGIGKGAPGVNLCKTGGHKVTYGNIELPSVKSFMPSNIATVNSNNRLRKCVSANNPVGCQQDTFTGTWSSTAPLTSARTISLSGGQAITVGGGDYWLCSLTMSGHSELIMKAGAKARFFFDTPENCGISSGAAQIKLTGTSGIVSTGNQPTLGQYDVPGFYLLGSTSRTTWVDLSGNHKTGNEMVIYGPDTNINLSGNTTYEGFFAGKEVIVTGSAVIENDAGFELPPELQTPPEDDDGDSTDDTPLERRYTPQTYVECTGAATLTPNSDC
jgi:hypothetical protein